MNINFSPIKFVIPSYNRAGKVKTIELLKKNNIDIKQIYIFVVEEEFEEYKKHYPEYKIIIGIKGLVKQREFINNYFKEGTKIVSIDDDIFSIRQFNQIEGVKTLIDTDLKSIVSAGFKECIRVHSYIWSIYPNDNYTRDMSDSITYDLCFLIGHFYGYINRHCDDLKIDYDQKEDYQRSLKYFLLDGVLVRFNNVCCITNTYKNVGGMNTNIDKRIEENNNTVDKLIKEYPEYIKLNKSRKSLLYKEIKLIKHKSKFQVVEQLNCIDKNDNIVLELVNELENTKFKINYKRLNSGVGLSMTLGSQRIRRKAGVYENSNNKLYPELYNKIKIFANKYIKNDYNAIQVNKNYETKPHRDICNKQNSSILGLGGYKGGKTRINGLLYDIRNKIISFNGKKYLHSNELSNNNKNRYSLVFFKL
tara:strand:- start:929 stop:2188 length:1260 start_codon:yes stop_codon:yes gene_type:complete